jgi:ABC-type phosphate/phosphonate transport system permease subunit
VLRFCISCKNRLFVGCVQFAPRAQARDMPVPVPPLGVRVRACLIWLTIGGLLAWGFAPVEMYMITDLATYWRNMAEFSSGFMQPNFSNWRQYLGEMVETVQIALWATALAVFFGIGDRARHRRGGRHRPVALRKHPQLPLYRHAVIILIVIATVVIVDLISWGLRKMLI